METFTTYLNKEILGFNTQKNVFAEFVRPYLDQFVIIVRNVVSEEIKRLNPSSDENKLYSRMEAAKYLGVSVGTIDNWRKNGHLKSYTVQGSNKVYFKHTDLVSCIKQVKKAMFLITD